MVDKSGDNCHSVLLDSSESVNRKRISCGICKQGVEGGMRNEIAD